MVVANKMDLNPYTKKEHYFPNSGQIANGSEQSPSPHDYTWVPTSALNKMNIEYLKEELYNAVISKKLNLESTIVANARHYEALQKSYESLDRVLEGMATGITSDFVAMDIRAALHHLGEITGEISTDDLLGNIFGKFCIEKDPLPPQFRSITVSTAVPIAL